MDSNQFTSKLERLKIILEPSEQVYEIIHKHWGQILRPFIVLGLFVLLSFFGSIYLVFSTSLTSTTVLYFLPLSGVWYLMLFGYGLSEWYSYRQSALVITNQRVIDYHQLNFLSRRIQTIDIHEVQSCSGEMMPVAGTIFNYGNLMINTIGDKPITISYISSPEVASGDVMHYHNLIAHGGQAAHGDGHIAGTEKVPVAPSQSASSQRPSSNNRETAFPVRNQPSLEANIIPRSEAEPKVPQIHPGSADNGTKVLLMFQVPSEELQNVLENLPAEKEPTITYLRKNDYYEVEIVISHEQLPNVVSQLQAKGVESLYQSDVHRLTTA